MSSVRKTSIVFGTMLIFGTILAVAVIKPAIDRGDIQPPWDTTYKPYVTTYAKAGKGAFDYSPSLRSVWSEVEGASSVYGFRGCWFCTGTKASLKITGPNGFYLEISDGPYGIDYNAEVTFNLKWKANGGPGKYTLQVKVFEVDDDGKPTGGVFAEKTCYVEIGQDSQTTDSPQTCM